MTLEPIDAEAVQSRRDGRIIRYSLTDQRVSELLAVLLGYATPYAPDA